MNTQAHTQRGFTLIELIVVIVILGILAATALPKFVDLQGDAGNGAADGVAGAMSSASSMNYAKRLAGGTGSGTALSPSTSNVCTDTTFWTALVTGTTFTTGTPTGNNQFKLAGGADSNCVAKSGQAVTDCTVQSAASGTAARTIPSVICP